ncbi:MAG: hypothetical protein Q8L68_05830, partial [Methylococcales bacterium]|nr:hypothetical protein [Methylococcales bacterium]
MGNKKGEIATLLTLGLVLVGAAITIATSYITNLQKNIASNPQATGGVTRYGSASCTCTQICGDYSNYVPSSNLITASGARQCTCKAAEPISTCGTNYNTNPVVPPVNDNPTNKCVSGAYTNLIDCTNTCGVGNCQGCLLNTTTKYECKVTAKPPSNLTSCVKPRTFASEANCKSECDINCTQCMVENMLRYQCGGDGPILKPPVPEGPKPGDEGGKCLVESEGGLLNYYCHTSLTCSKQTSSGICQKTVGADSLTVSTDSAIDVKATSARLRGRVNNIIAGMTYYFRYKQANATTIKNTSSKNYGTVQMVYEQIQGLTPNTKYNYAF